VSLNEVPGSLVGAHAPGHLRKQPSDVDRGQNWDIIRRLAHAALSAAPKLSFTWAQHSLYAPAREYGLWLEAAP
jgi:hypothetical protein